MDDGVSGAAESPWKSGRDDARRGPAPCRHLGPAASPVPRWLLIGGSLAYLCAVALGCGRNLGPSVGAAQPVERDSIFIIVENQNFYDAAVYVQFQGGTRRRLATVQAYSTVRQSVRYDPGEMWFHVDFVGARFATRSRAINLSPGETVQLELTASAHRTGQLITRRRGD